MLDLPTRIAMAKSVVDCKLPQDKTKKKGDKGKKPSPGKNKIWEK